MAVMLRHFNQLSVKEAAWIMDCKPGTVKSLCSQGIHQLQSGFHPTGS